MAQTYVTGHRNPDTDSIAAAVGYAELKAKLDPGTDYTPVRLGEVNAQTRWVLDHAGAPEPELLPHVRLRVRDVMQADFPTARHDEPLRDVGLAMAEHRRGYVPVLGEDGRVAGMFTERALARKYVRESRGASEFGEDPLSVRLIVDVLEGRILVGEDRDIHGRLWVAAVDVASMPEQIGPGDVVVVGDREDIQRWCIEEGVALLAISHGKIPPDDVLALAAERGTTIVSSPLDSYVTGRMLGLAVPCRAVMERDPLLIAPDDLVDEVADRIMDVEYRAAIVTDPDRSPVGLVTRSDLVHPRPRRVILVDHAEAAQSVPGVEDAEIVEILDHHHIGSIETKLPVAATFDPVGSTATLVVERFRQNGVEPAAATAGLLLGGILSDTVVLSSPTTTDRDHAAAAHLGRALDLDPTGFGREMFAGSSDVSDVPAEELVARDAKQYDVDAGTICIAQVETVGRGPLERKGELLAAMDAARERDGHLLYALMVTDIVAGGTQLLVSGEAAPAERAFSAEARDGVIDLPGVMSRKRQVAPQLMGAF